MSTCRAPVYHPKDRAGAGGGALRGENAPPMNSGPCPIIVAGHPGIFAGMSIRTISLGRAFGLPDRGAWRAPDVPRRCPVSILGVPFDPVTADEALARIAELVEAGEPRYVVTPNVDFLVQARVDAELHRILCEAELVLCDGQPLVWASRWLGNPLPERVAGADLAPRLLAQAARRGHRVFLLGASPEANAAAVRRLREVHPALRLVGHFSPPHAPLERMDHGAILRRVRAARPDLLIVGFGCPKQEKWIARFHRELGVPVCLGMGGTIDFLAGRLSRAPRWMRRAGLEWSYRLMLEPRRLFRRYATDLRCFAAALAAQWWHQRRAAARARAGLDRLAVEGLEGLWREIETAGGDCRIDLGGVNFIDATGAAALTVWRRVLRRKGHRLVLDGPRGQVERLLRPLGLDGMFGAEPGVAP